MVLNQNLNESRVIILEKPDGTLVYAQADSSGNLKITGAAGGGGTEYTEGDVDATFTGPVVQGEGPSNTATPLQLDASGNLKIAQDFETTSGSITAISQTVTETFANIKGTVGLRITGTWVGTIAFQVSVNGTDFVSSEALPVASGIISTATNANGDWHIPVGGMKAFRVFSSAWTSGTASIEITAGADSHISEVYSESADNLKSQSFGSVTTAAPSYTDGTTRSLSLTTSGGLRTDLSGTTVPLPTGAATSALQTQPGVDIGDVTINNAAGASAVNIQDGGNSITVDGTVGATQSGTWNITNVSGTVSLPTGASTLAEQQTQTASLSVIDDWDESDRAKVNPIVGQAGVAANAGSVSALTQRVVHGTGSTPTLANVATSTANTTILAANTSALTRSIHNDSTANLLIKFGATASATSFITKIPPGITLFFDQGDYNGQVDGLLESGTGTARTSVVTA